MTYYHVSSYAQDGQIYFANRKPLQEYIDQFESFSVDNYAQFIKTCDAIPDTILQDTGIRKSKWLCELVFEKIRKENFEWAPRRLHSIYLCSSLEEAKLFNKRFRENKAFIFEAIFEGNAYQFDMNIFTCAEEYLAENIVDVSEKVYEDLKDYAFEYWKQKSLIKQKECLYEGNVELRRIYST